MARPRLAPAALLLALAACHHRDSGKALEQADGAAQNADDPALTGALGDQIMVDPDLAAQSNAHVARSPAAPVQAGIPFTRPSAPPPGPVEHAPAATPGPARPEPATLGELAARGSACRGALRYSAAWATKMPDGLPVYPQGAVDEAAGYDTPACHLRVVSFTTGASAGDVIDFYYTHVRHAGYDAAHRLCGRDHLLVGSRSADGAAYYVSAVPGREGGTQVDIVASAGR